MLQALGVRIEVQGALPDQAVLIAPNHTSWLDSFVLAAAFRTAMAGRADVLDWPFFGRVARTMGVVPVHRDRASATADFVDEVRRRLAAGVNVLAFPEGTTTHGLSLLPFKTGMFEAVAGTPYAVLPVYHQIVRAKGQRVTPATLAPLTWAGEEASIARSFRQVIQRAPLNVIVRVGHPLAAAQESRKTLAAHAHAAVEALRADVLAAAEERDGAEHIN